YATRNNRHIRVSFFVKKLPESAQKVILFICDILFLIFATFVLIASIYICMTVARFDDRAVTLDISMNILYAAGVVGYVLMLIRIVQGLVWKIQHWKDNAEIFENFGGDYTPNNKIFFDYTSDDPIMEEMEEVIHDTLEKEEGK
ncbi:MAG: TRAP transporter small permease subunit, partial [Eubacterium sp.]